MHRDASLPFKAFVPHMVTNLEDSDGTVRDAAKSALIELFKCVLLSVFVLLFALAFVASHLTFAPRFLVLLHPRHFSFPGVGCLL